jgi:hypothetical protein
MLVAACDVRLKCLVSVAYSENSKLYAMNYLSQVV